jgi:LEA14-like dessication related protein
MMALTSCAPIRPIEFRSISDFKITNLTSAPEVSVNLNLYNPNSIGGKVKEFDLEFFLSDAQIATIQLKNVRVGSRREFTLPLSTNASYDQIIKFLPSGLSSFLNGKDIPVNLTGKVTMKKFLFKKTFPFQFHDSINTKNIKLD